VEISQLCAAYGVEHREVDNLQDLIVELVETTEVSGFTVIEARTVRDTRRELQRELNSKVR
jgi:2-succinyl-5-enolpyruvyl-6-hydroxy-3-cyclohexene-1-carboxylate synthase